jgi:hypothetical protein
MARLFELLRTRLIPAVLTAAGIALVTAGLLSYTVPVEDGPAPTAEIDVEITPSPVPLATPGASGSISPSASPSVAPSPSAFPKGRVATRVAIPGLHIDLPVVKPGGQNDYPLCDVAQYLKNDRLGQPGQGRATYIYAHAREGMFLPILDASKVNNGTGMLGMLVYVYTSDDQLFLYEVTRVRRHVPYVGALEQPFRAKTEQLWLQTSEGHGETFPKLQLKADYVTSGPTSHASAHPKPHPVVCG